MKASILIQALICNQGDLKCGKDNCNRADYPSFDATDDCCQRGSKVLKKWKVNGVPNYQPTTKYEQYMNILTFQASCLSYLPITMVKEGACCPECFNEIYDPKCGSDGVTYQNQCNMEYVSLFS